MCLLHYFLFVWGLLQPVTTFIRITSGLVHQLHNQKIWNELSHLKYICIFKLRIKIPIPAWWLITTQQNVFYCTCLALHMRPHGIQPRNNSRWGQLQGCMSLHTQSLKSPKPVISLIELTAVLAAATYSIGPQSSVSSGCVRASVCVLARAEVNEKDVACLCVLVVFLYLAALNSSASCSPNHAFHTFLCVSL